jgi:opacity protein-like surface antigen
MKIVKFIVISAVIVLTAGAAAAQEPVPGLQDLIGARGGDGEYQMERRGYTFVRTEKSGDSAFSYWHENENGQCVTVRTTDGRYASIVFAPEFDCKGGGQPAHDQSGYDRKDEFETVCGVMVNGEDYRYKCKIADFYRGSDKFRSVLHMPDQTIHMRWKSGRDVELHFEGMNPQKATYSTSEGETNFRFEDKTYYYYSDKSLARMEVQHFQN